MRALVVDDSAVMRKVLMDALGQAGILDVGQAADGKEAVAAVVSKDYDVVLMDWNMPKLSGIDAVKEIRAKGKDVPIIMVTTEAEKSRVIEALKAGANSYIIKPFKKPFKAAQIVSKIHEILGSGVKVGASGGPDPSRERWGVVDRLCGPVSPRFMRVEEIEE